jgi:non-specific serine/threonine protein kinase
VNNVFALHGLWRADQRLALWAEGPPAQEGPHARPWHPFAVATGLLAKLLGGVGTALEWLVSARAVHGTAELLLPSHTGGPAPSPELAFPGDRRAGAELLAWRVPALVFEPVEAAQLLGELYNPHRPFLPTELPDLGTIDVPYGGSLRWLTSVHDLAWRMVGQGQLLPVLVTEDGLPHARWRPAPDAAHWEEITALTAAIPPACRAEVVPDPAPAHASAPPEPEQSAAGSAEPGRPARNASEIGDQPEGRPEADRRRSLTSVRYAWPQGSRRLGRTGRARQGGRPGSAVTSELLDAMVDCEARAALEDQPSLLGSGRKKGAATTAAERWLSALSSASGAIEESDPRELADLRATLAAWHRSEAEARPRLRTCFRLVEPVGTAAHDDEVWRLEFLLQAVDEPSLLVKAADVWTSGPALRALEQKVDRPREMLLADLGRAAHHYPVVQRALRSIRPSRLDLDRDMALEFLREAAPALAADGFGVLLPSWWQRPARVGLALHARAVDPGLVRGESRLPKESLTSFSWRVSVGDETLTDRELADLASAKQPLVRIRGQWMEVNPDQIRAAARFLAMHDDPEMSAAEVVRAALDPDVRFGGLPVTSVVADGRVGELLAGGLELDPVTMPGDFGTTLRPYQERGVAWLDLLSRLGLGAVLADDMGLGKTVQTLALLAAEHHRRQASHPTEHASPTRRKPRSTRVAAETTDEGPTLLICPMSLVGNWQREAARFTPSLRVHVHHGPGRPSGEDLRKAIDGADLVITTYGLVQRDFASLSETRWRRIVADEAQHIKNSATRQARAVRALTARHRIALTGTPVENRLGEFHAILDFANPGLFGSHARFKELYSLPIERTGSIRATEALRRRTRPLVLRRLKTDPAIVNDLPSKQEMTVLCNLTAEQAALYRAVVTDLLDGVMTTSDESRTGRVLASLSKLKQICNHPAQFLKEPGPGARFSARSGKVAQLEEILQEALAEGDKVLCFTQFAEFGHLLARYLPKRLGTEVLFLHGATPRQARERMVERFQKPGGPSVFLLSLKAGGTGLNLTAANQVVHIDRWWNPAVEEQATDRAFRIGQRRDVQVRKLVSVGTLEERIDAMIETKRSLAETTVGVGEGWLADLSTDALHELIDLASDAVSE